MTKPDLQKLLNVLDISEEDLCSLAKETGFIKRIRKIDPLDFLHSLISESVEGTISYNDMASSIEISNATFLSRQAICKKVTDNCTNFFKIVLALIILAKVEKHLDLNRLAQYRFKRILIQDSTIIKLPIKLFNLFFGVSNASVTVCNARIQGIFDLLTGRFILFTIDPYSKNDQSSAKKMVIMKDDLTLRDRGYLTVNEIRRHTLSGAHCIYRHKVNVSLLDYETKEPIDLLALLQARGSVDIKIRLNDEQQTAVRLVAQPVDQETADKRRMKAKKTMRGHNPGKLLLALQSWTIFITTIPTEDANFEEVLYLYGLRWKIETIFKCWKSNLCFASIHNVSSNQLTIILIARMIMFLIITQVVFMPCNALIYKQKRRYVSILKLTRYLCRHPEMIIKIVEELFGTKDKSRNPIDTVERYCLYDKRKRNNFEQKLALVLS